MRILILALLACGALAQKQAPTIHTMRSIYIEKMDNNLDQFIRAEITKQMKGRLTVVLNKREADGVMTGMSTNDTGVSHRITGRYLGLHDTATGAISIVDRSGKQVLWSTEAGDRSIWFGSVKRGGPRKVADRIVHNLKKDIGK